MASGTEDDDAGPPPGVEEQFSLGGFPSVQYICAATLNGPGGGLVTIELPEYVLAPLLVGALEVEETAGSETRPHLIGTITDIVQVTDFVVERAPTVTAAEQPLGNIVTIEPRSLDLITRTTITLPEDFFIPTVTLPPDVADPVVVDPAEEIRAIETLGRGLICGSGWNPNSFLQVTVAAGDEVVSEQFVQAGSDGSLSGLWQPTPDNAPGLYTIAATDGTASADRDILVEPSSFRRVHVLSEGVGNPGDTFVIGAAGFTPGAEINLHLYRLGEPEGFGQTWFYEATLAPVIADQFGAAVAVLETTDQAEGEYCLLGDGMQYALVNACSDAGFILGGDS